jgi:hypothetical protein
MYMNNKFARIFFLLALMILLAVIAMGCSQPKGEKKTEATKTESREGAYKAADSTYNSLMTATTLYVCPMHPDFISADPNAKCNICNMNTEKMSEEQVAAFRAKLKNHK